jgi:5-methylcytosine-specific restriction endonuclease McrA
MAARRQHAIEYLGARCAFCERTQDEVKLEFDHIRPRRATGRPPISAILSYRWERQLEELAEVWLLCTDCHRVKTRDDRPELLHGHNMYVQYGCRCDECRAGHAAVNKAWRHKVKGN